jgi:hypothetical protein
VGRRHQRHGMRPVRPARRADCAVRRQDSASHDHTPARTDRPQIAAALASRLLIGSRGHAGSRRCDLSARYHSSTGPIAIINPGDDISCVNVYDRTNPAM